MNDCGTEKLLRTVKKTRAFITSNKGAFEDALPGIAEALMGEVNDAANSKVKKQNPQK